MRRSLVLVVALLALAGAAVILVPRFTQRTSARSAIVRYDEALADSLSRLDPRPLEAAAGPREVQRVTNYITYLWGSGISVQAELQELHVVSLASASPTVTVEAEESWRYQDRDRATGAVRGEPRTQRQRLRYTLLPARSGLRVELAEIVEGAGR